MARDRRSLTREGAGRTFGASANARPRGGLRRGAREGSSPGRMGVRGPQAPTQTSLLGSNPRDTYQDAARCLSPATPGDLCADWQATCPKDQAGNGTEEGENQGGRRWLHWTKDYTPRHAPHPQVFFPPREKSDPTAGQRRVSQLGRPSPPGCDACPTLTGKREEGIGTKTNQQPWPGWSTQLAQECTPHTSLPICLRACCRGVTAIWATTGPGTFTPRHT